MQGEIQDDVLDHSHLLANAANNGKLFTVPGYPTFYTPTVGKFVPDYDAVQFTDALGEELGVSTEDWEWSNNKTGDQTFNKINRLCEPDKPFLELDPVDFMLYLLELAYKYPHKDGAIIRSVPHSLDDDLPDRLAVHDSAAGYEPHGIGAGNRRQAAMNAISVFESVSLGGLELPPLVYQPLTKGKEFLPKDKDQRKIFCESTFQNIAFQLCFPQIYNERNLFTGSAKNLSLGGNTGYQYLMKIFGVWDGTVSVADAYNELDQAAAISTSDKKRWEYCMHPVMKMVALARLLCSTDFSMHLHYLVPLTHCIASYVNPLVAIHCNCVISAPQFGPSGSVLTLDVNSDVHLQMPIGFKLANIGHPDMESWFRSFLVQGDDAICRNKFPHYDDWCDTKYGTTTVTQTGPISQSLFLQRSLQLKGGKLPMLTYHRPRALVKMCAPRRTLGNSIAAVISLVHSTGDLDLAAAVLPLLREFYPLPLAANADGRFFALDAIDPGTLQRFWLPNKKLNRHTAVMYKLQKYGITPDELDRLLE